ncbi:Probable ATP-dependent RNA helicase DDX20 [Strongyloides ratti]|uniref:RNA helicase n=1 Tax=Strongyloides ratti TaxID=34506 RepID=A0A090LAT9_STRRB|nr:Probable ATP-dependent RNA helicase DDX20 [Strongyloides ratti]CEF66911.1 Probable ATP-dependent RNA helicase DDX20 [Strongyloides ratti]
MDFITKYIDVQDDSQRTLDVSTNECFENLSIPSEMIKKFNEMRIWKPSPIQAATMPMTLCGADLLVQAKSGTGKTLVFAAMSIIVTMENELYPQTIIVSPTREICEQIFSILQQIDYKNLKIGLCCGGENTYKSQKRRLAQLVSDGILDLSNVTTFVMDEADKMVEGNFQSDISMIFSHCNENKQTCVFSATYPKEMLDVLSGFMIDTTMIRLDSENVQLLGIKQFVQFEVKNIDKHEFTSAAVLAANILKRQQFNQAILFVNETKFLIEFAQQLCKYLQDYSIQLMSGSMLQKERSKVMSDLKNRKIKVLISTDLLSRGVDSQHIDLVINVNCPVDCCTYLHRIGRAGRFGNYGASFTLIDNIKNLIKFTDMVDSENLAVKFLSKDILRNSHLTTDRNAFDECKDFNGDFVKEICCDLCDVFKCGRYVEKNNVPIICYTKDEMMKINEMKSISEWQVCAKDVFKNCSCIFYDIGRDKFIQESKKETFRRNNAFDKFTKLRLKSDKIVEKDMGKKSGTHLSYLNRNSNEEINKDEGEINSSPTKMEDDNNKTPKVEYNFNENINDQKLYVYSRDELMKIFNSKTIDQWRAIFIGMNLKKEIYKHDPIVMDAELRKPFTLQLRVLRKREKEKVNRLRKELEKNEKNIIYGKIDKDWPNSIKFPSIPSNPKNIYSEVYNLATGNGRYSIPSNNNIIVSPSSLRGNGDNLKNIGEENKTITKKWFISQANSIN